MRKKRFSVEHMIGVLKQAKVGVPVAEVTRKAGISEQTFYCWKAKYAGLEVDQVRQMAQLQEENLRLKQPPNRSSPPMQPPFRPSAAH
jgi:putative transposase